RVPLIQIQGPENNSGWDGLTLASGSGGSTIAGLSISGFAIGAGISIESDDNLILADYLGIDIMGGTAQPNASGVFIDQASGNTIGGAVSSARNLISSNGDGIDIQGPNASGNWILGNLVGTDAAGTGALVKQSEGIVILNGAQYNTIGGLE